MEENGRKTADKGEQSRRLYWGVGGSEGLYYPGGRDKTLDRASTGDKYIEAYLDAFGEFCDGVRERYGAKVIGNLTSEAMINLYRGFIAALPDLERSAQRESHHKPNQATRSGMRTPEKYERDRTLLRKLRRHTNESIQKGTREHKAPLGALLHGDGRI
ncbi:MAG: hypothetical protein GWP10_06965, partial [Nitrospiraceae bacterium]|nr:hypothetical protein [Nitrospiraceae bacterium]